LDIEQKLTTLGKVAQRLNEKNIIWAVGASALLYLEGLTTDFHDFDLLIAPRDIPLATEVFMQLGARRLPRSAPSPDYATAQFVEVMLDGVDFDLLCGFAIRRKEVVYPYPFSENRVAHTVNTKGALTPLTPLADWFVLYQLMPVGARKAALIGRHLKAHAVGDTRLWLSDWLNNRLPGDVRENVMALYASLP